MAGVLSGGGDRMIQRPLFPGYTDPPYPGRGRPPVVRWGVLARVQRGELERPGRRERRHLTRLLRDGFVVAFSHTSTRKVEWRACGG